VSVTSCVRHVLHRAASYRLLSPHVVAASSVPRAVVELHRLEWGAPAQERCSECLKGKYYRLDGECIKCPNNPWVVAAGAIAIAIFVCTGAYILNKKAVNIGMLAIMVDFAQVRQPSLCARRQSPVFRCSYPVLMRRFPFLKALACACRLSRSSLARRWRGRSPSSSCSATCSRSVSTSRSQVRGTAGRY
jgi:hypothetical protein